MPGLFFLPYYITLTPITGYLFCSQNRPLMPFQHIFSFSERKLDISNFAGKLLTVYNMIRSCLKISSSSWETDKKSSQAALKLEVPKMPKITALLRSIFYYKL
jgi:hypothetical protein